MQLSCTRHDMRQGENSDSTACAVGANQRNHFRIARNSDVIAGSPQPAVGDYADAVLRAQCYGR
jgi:hypothetical protein